MMLTFYKLFNDNKKNWRPNCSNPFSLNIAELIEHLNGGKKNYLLAPFFWFTSFKRVAANLCIIWSKGNDILTKRWGKYKKLTPFLQFWMQTKKYWNYLRFAKVYCCPISTYPTCVTRPPCFLIFRILSFLFLHLVVFQLQ